MRHYFITCLLLTIARLSATILSVISIENERDPEVLRQIARLQETEIARLVARNRTLAEEIARLKGEDTAAAQQEIERLEQLVALRNRALFGPSSEKRPAEPAQAEQSAPAEPGTRKGHGPRPQASLPVVVSAIELAPTERTCEACGGELVPMGAQFEESEEITIVERKFVKTVHQRQKYRCACNGCVVTAPAPDKLIPGGRYSIDFAVEVIVAKYLDHLPLERQARIMGREGLEVTSQTLWDQLWAASRHLEPLYRAIGDEVRGAPMLHADETRWPVMGKSGEADGSKQWWMWNLTSARQTYYEIHPTRSARAARSLIADWRGIAMVDGYGAYETAARAAPGVRLAHCWAHVRRKFIEIESSFPRETAAVLSLIAELYAIEGEADDATASGDEERLEVRATLRATRSRELVRRILEWTGEVQALPRSGLGQAIAYMKGIWAGLTAFVDDPRIPLDNNAAERALRGPVVGRKNHYGSKSQRGTEVAAMFYTLLETAKLEGIEPKAWLRAALLAAIRAPGATLLPSQFRAQ